MKRYPAFYLTRARADLPRNFSAELRAQLDQLGPPPACLRFSGCVRLVYRTAQQIGAQVMVQRQKDGTCLIWKRAADRIPVTTPGPVRETPAEARRGVS
jgi:hypothetical protein